MNTATRVREATPASGPAGAGQDVVIFGASGDLSNRKILPALGRLSANQDLRVIGAGRRAMDCEQFREVVARSSGNPALAASARWIRLDYAAVDGYRHLRDAAEPD